MKTVKFYNKTTGRWEPIAGISTTGGVSDYNDLSNKPDLSVYALKSELEALREELTNLINSQEPDSQYYTEYTIDNSASTFSLRSVDNPINNGQYIPQFSGGYEYIKLTLTNGNVTTNLNTSASEVEKIKIYYPAGTSYVKFTDTKVKDVEHIECSNFTDATSMFKNCVSLEHADLSTLDSSKVTVDNTMFMGANTDVQLQFNDEWSYTHRDMGLIKMVDVVMHHYREDGLYENSSIYIKSQYDEHPIQYVIVQVDPEDERWRLEPLSLEYETSYEIYFEDNGNTGETMNTRFMANMDIFFVGATPNSFTESRPEIGGNEEPEEEYITGFSVSDSSLGFSTFGNSYTITITPNETGRPMNFVVDELEHGNFKTGIDYNIQNTDMGANLQVSIRSHASYSSGQLVIRETYSNTTQTISVFINPKISLTVHYKATDDDYYGDTLALNFDFDPQEIRLDSAVIDEYDDYEYYVQLEVPGNSTCPAVLQHNNPGFNGMTMMSLNTTNSTMSIWISDDSSEILYENPNQPEEPGEPGSDPIAYTLTINMYDPNGYSRNNVVLLEDAVGNGGTCFVCEGSTNDFGIYNSIELPGGASYSVDVQDSNGTITRLSSDITMDSDKEIWVIAGDSTLYTERPEIGGGDTPEEPEDDGLVDMVFHINDFKNAFNKLTVISSYEPYVSKDYDLENAQSDDYGKFITIKLKPNTNNDINVSSNYGYDDLGIGIDATNYSEIWCDTMNINLPSSPTRPDTITSLEGTYKLKINYYPHDLDISNGDSMRLDEGNYKRWINYKSSENNWYVYEEDVIANHVINFDAYGFYGEIPALTEDTEIWLISHNYDIYTTKPEVPNFTPFNTRVHLHKQGSDYSEGWHLYVYTGNNSNAYGIPQENVDEFGLYFDIPESLYTNIRHAFQFYSDAGDWLSIFDSKFTETHSELWMIDGDSTIYTEKPEI